MNAYEQAREQFNQEAIKETERRAERLNKLLVGKLEDVEYKKELDKALCKQNINYWLKNYVWVYEPRPVPRNLPYISQPFQENMLDEILKAVSAGYDLRIEKSRDMRVTWTVLIAFTYLWQFHGMTFLVGSRKAEEVDKLGDLDTLLPKVRFLLEKQPKWLLPKGFSLNEHSGYMNIQNPETKGTISGESNNPSFGTGGRRNAIFFDEFAKWEYSDSRAWISAGANTPCRIGVSTPFFKNNRFYLLSKEPIRNLTVHWSEDLLKGAGLTEINGKKTSPWYEMQKLRYRPDELAQEFDISYAGTQQSAVFHDELAEMRIEKRICPVAYTPGLPLIWAFDPGIGSIWANGFYQVLGASEEIRWFDYYENQNRKISHYIDWVKSPERSWNKVFQDKPVGQGNYRPGWKQMIVIPDPNQGPNRELANEKSLINILQEAGFTNIFIRRIGKMEAISEAKWLMAKLWMDDGTTSPRMNLALDRIQAYHYKYNEATSEYEREPLHDVNSHCADQFKYFAGWLMRPEKMQQQLEQKMQTMAKEIETPVHREVGMAGI